MTFERSSYNPIVQCGRLACLALVLALFAAPLLAQPVPPVLTSISPDDGAPGSIVPVTITGSGFDQDLQSVNVSNESVLVTNVLVVDNSTIMATFDLTNATESFSVSVTVDACLPTSTCPQTSNSLGFAVVNLTLQSILPGAGTAGSTVGVTLTGSGFSSSLQSVNVTNGLTVSNVAVVSDTTITATINMPVSSVGTASVNVTVNPCIRISCPITSTSLPFTVAPPIVITSGSTLPPGDANALYSYTLAAAGGIPPYLWTAIGNGLPSWLSLQSSTGVLSGTPPTAGTYGFTIQVQDTAGAIAAQSFSVLINPPLTITTSSLPAGVVGVNYSQILADSGGIAPFNWSLASGALPAGLTLNPTTGQITGLPSAAGTSNFTVQLTDAAKVSVTKALSIVINAGLTITTSSPLPSGTVGVAYAQTLAATGGSGQYTWAITVGALPAGLSLNAATGQITGSPTSAGTANFTVQVTDTNQLNASKPFALTINPALSITTASPLPPGTVAVSYSQTLTATGGSGQYTWSVISGALPGGLSLNPSTGQITGTPTAASFATFTVQVTDTNQTTATKQFVLVVNGVLTITSTSPLATGAVGVSYFQILIATGGTLPYTWSLTSGNLPAGLALTPAGQISGTPTASGPFSFTIQVKDNQGSVAAKPFSLTINGSLVITSKSPLPAGTVGAAYSQTLQAAGGTLPYTWLVSGGSLPAGLALNASSGQIAGTPSAAGTASFTIQVTDANGVTGSAPFTLTISQALTIVTTSLPNGTVGVSYSQTITVSGGTPPYTFSGTLPAGLSLNTSTGQITGTPTASGSQKVTIQVTDSLGVTASKQFTLTINPANQPLTIVTSSRLPAGTIGVNYSVTLQANGGTAPYTWSIASGTIPGLSINAATGELSGKPTTAGTFKPTIQVTDSTGATASASFSVTIASSLVISTPVLPAPVLGGTYSQQLAAAGTGPFTWSIGGGSLPAGLSLSSDGILSGKATVVGAFTFTVVVTDASQNTAQATFTVTIEPLPATVHITATPSVPASGQPLTVTVSLPQPYPVDLKGQLTFQFTPSSVPPVDDPMILFKTGGRTATFTIPGCQASDTSTCETSVTLPLQTGTIAGTLAFTLSATAGGLPVTLTNNAGLNVTLAAQPPTIVNVTIVPSGSSFNVVVTGYSNTREVTEADFQFAANSGSQIQNSTITPDGVSSAFQTWFATQDSAAFGSQFTYTQPFNLTTGAIGTLQSVTVTLKNSVGASSTMSATF